MGDRIEEVFSEDQIRGIKRLIRNEPPVTLETRDQITAGLVPLNTLTVSGDGAGDITLSSASIVDLPQFSGSFTGTGRGVRIDFLGTFTTVANSALRIMANIDGTDWPGRLLYIGIPSVTVTLTTSGFTVVPTLTRGLHTIKLRYVCTIGGNTLYNNLGIGGSADTNRCIMHVAEI